MRRTLILLALTAAPLTAQTLQIGPDSLNHHCPPGSMSVEATGDTLVIRPELYELTLGQQIYLRAFLCGSGKVKEVSRASGVQWRSSDTTIVKITKTTGRVTVVKVPGVVDITVCYPMACSNVPRVGVRRDAIRVFTVRRST